MRIPFFLLALAALTACRKDQIDVRRVPKEDASPTAASDAPARPKGLTWTTPPTWKELAGNGMRAATFQLPQDAGKIEATVVALPGDVGGELANVNRWRGQLALSPINEADLPSLRASIRCRLGDVLVYDFVGTGHVKTRLVAGMIQVSGTTWFFKLMGDEKAAAAAKPAFIRLLESLKSDAP